MNSLVKNIPRCSYEIIIVDNNSQDGTQEFLTQFSNANRNIFVILNKTNKGYAAGNNIGIRAARGETVILLNNDTLVSKGWIDLMLAVFRRDPKIGLVGPVTNNAGNIQRIDIPGLNENNFEFRSKNYIKNQSNHIHYTNRLGFFCVAIKRNAINKIGILDEAYGLGYFEDDDYCFRAISLGFKLCIIESCFIYHKGSISFSKLPRIEYKKIFENNKLYFQKKNLCLWTLDDILYSYFYKFIDDLNLFASKRKLKSDAEIERIIMRIAALEHLIVQIKESKLIDNKNSVTFPGLASEKWKIRRNTFKRHFIHGSLQDRFNYLKDFPSKLLRLIFAKFNNVPFIHIEGYGPDVISAKNNKLFITYTALNPNISFDILIGDIRCFNVKHLNTKTTAMVPLELLKNKKYNIFIQNSLSMEIIYVGKIEIL
ncbi:glycosyltransferase family 2 protein [Candidatus Methylopumilus universalis]|uniref:glycosyltransferase family 2 protein n=1 Tax=Candidatus Methylopumilus universalis TaxID=2588536 RepID=UPI003B976B37